MHANYINMAKLLFIIIIIIIFKSKIIKIEKKLPREQVKRAEQVERRPTFSFSSYSLQDNFIQVF